MMKSSFIKLLIPIACSFHLSFSISNRYIDYKSSTLDQKPSFYSYTYKGIEALNRYGWFITQKWDTPLKMVELNDKWYEVKKYYPHNTLEFAIFKIDKNNDLEIDKDLKLEYIANQNDLDHYHKWVVSCAFVPDPLSSEGKINYSIKGYNKPLLAISSIRKQKNGYLFLDLSYNLKDFFKEVYSIRKRDMMKYNLKNSTHISTNLKSDDYKNSYFEKLNQKLNQKIDSLNQRIIKNRNQKSINIEQMNIAREEYKNDYIEPYLMSDDLTTIQNIDDKEKSNILDFTEKLQAKIKRTEKKIKAKQNKINVLSSYFDPLQSWRTHQEKLEKKRKKYVDSFNFYNSWPNLYKDKDIESKMTMEVKRDLYSIFECNKTGVANKEDHGGLIFVNSENLCFSNGRYFYPLKVAGITCAKNKNDFIWGQKSVAIDLTTQEVYNWISEKIDEYYEQQESQNRKRPYDDLNSDDPLENLKRICCEIYSYQE